MNRRIRFAIVGTGKRSDYLYAPVLNILKEDVEFVGVWGRSEDKARGLGEKHHVPWFTDLDRLRSDLEPARLDQEVTLAMHESARNSGASVRLPLQREP